VIPTATPSRLPPSPTFTPTSVFVRYTVVRGDTLGNIAQRFGLSLKELLRINGLAADTVIQEGQVLLLPRQLGGPLLTATPTPTPLQGYLIYTVEEGDTLSEIAVRYHVSMAEIAKENGMSVDAILRVGQKLRIPGLVPTATVTPSPSATTTATASPSPSPTEGQRFRYPQPRLLAPADEALIRSESVLLNWTAVGILRSEEWYLLRLWLPAQASTPREIRTKATSYRLPVEWHPVDKGACKVAWQVTVVEQHGPEGKDTVELAPPSELRIFSWMR